MRRILFLPLFQFPTGHHQAAEALMKSFEENIPYSSCKKVDFLSYTNKSLESISSKVYMNLITKVPNSYDQTYKKYFFSQSRNTRLFKFYEYVFLEEMESLINMEQPDMIVCTHGFPSFLLNELKKHGKCHVPVINAYTDFFVNDLWGRDHIDYHLVSSQTMKETLLKGSRLKSDQVMVTGVPVDKEFEQSKKVQTTGDEINVLIAGGNSGLNNSSSFLEEEDENITFYILCGKNKKLFEDLLSMKTKNIIPLPYISSREEMNILYNKMDAIITKPGGVTVSEALRKEMPIILNQPLPGQEEINAEILEEMGVSYSLDAGERIVPQIKNVIQDRERYLDKVEQYLDSLEVKSSGAIASTLEAKILKAKLTNLTRHHIDQSISTVMKDYFLRT